MISVADLIKWADEHAIGRSGSYPRGWITHNDLRFLAAQIEIIYPRDYYYSMQSNLPYEINKEEV